MDVSMALAVDSSLTEVYTMFAFTSFVDVKLILFVYETALS